MSINIINQIKNLFGDNFNSSAAAALGESESSLAKGMSGLIPTVLLSLINRGGSSSGIGNILSNITGDEATFNPGSILNNINNSESGSLMSGAGPLLTSLFGDKIANVTAGLSNYSGLKGTSISALLATIAPAILGFIKRFTSNNNLHSDAQVMGFLNDQKPNVLAAVPAGLDVYNLIDIPTAATHHNRTTIDAAPYDEPRIGGAGWLLWLILLALAGILVWYLMKGCNETPSNTPPAVDTLQNRIDTPFETPKAITGGELDSMGNWIADWGAEKTINLQDGTVLNVGENSTEYKLYNFLTDNNFQVDTINKQLNWVSFDRVYFETGKSILTATSQAQIKNIAAILKNFPNAVIKIGGYTDNTGSATDNKKISEDRAKIVARELEKLGAKKNQIAEAVGYGPEHPICAANDSDECKAQNRRVDLKVAAK